MTARTSSAKRPTLTASLILEAVASDLMQIKNEERLTYADIGRVLGKGEDQAARYCDGSAEMGLVAYTFARREWNGRFSGTVDTLVTGVSAGTCDRGKATHIARALLELNEALENDDEADATEIRIMRKTLEAARDSIDELLKRLAVRSVA